MAKWLRLGAVVEAACQLMRLTPEQRAETIPSGKPRATDRVLWALTYLTQAGAVERPSRGRYVITERGRRLLTQHPDGFGVDALRQFEEFREFQSRSKGTTGNEEGAEPTDTESTPVEQIADSIVRLDAAVAQELVERIRQQPPEFLERVVLELLIAMGYGGTTGEVKHIGGVGDAGFDGVINQDALGIGRIYVQAKRYAIDNVVGRPAIQGFPGALHGAGASGGVFITTSRFSAEAVSFAATVKPTIVLIDAEQLGALLVKHGVGVQERETYRVVEIDEDFFE
jgi:restriction system protein